MDSIQDRGHCLLLKMRNVRLGTYIQLPPPLPSPMRPLYFTKIPDFKACFQPNSTIYSIYSFVESNFFLNMF